MHFICPQLGMLCQSSEQARGMEGPTDDPAASMGPKAGPGKIFVCSRCSFSAPYTQLGQRMEKGHLDVKGGKGMELVWVARSCPDSSLACLSSLHRGQSKLTCPPACTAVVWSVLSE